MKILKMPNIKPIKCPCGCEYELEQGDEIVRFEMQDLDGTTSVQCYLPCPFCGRQNELMIEKTAPNSNNLIK